MNQGATIFSGTSPRAVTLTMLGLMVAIAGIMALAAGPAQAGKIKQSNCQKLSKKLKNAKGKNQKLRLKFNLKSCKKNKKVYNRIKDSRFVGVRSDGEPIDITLCANGKAADDVDSEFKDVYKKGWIIEGARYRNKKRFEGGFSASLGGTSARVGAIRLGKNGWEVGISGFDGSDLDNYGPAKKTNARKICRNL